MAGTSWPFRSRALWGMAFGSAQGSCKEEEVKWWLMKGLQMEIQATVIGKIEPGDSARVTGRDLDAARCSGHAGEGRSQVSQSLLGDFNP